MNAVYFATGTSSRSLVVLFRLLKLNMIASSNLESPLLPRLFLQLKLYLPRLDLLPEPLPLPHNLGLQHLWER